MLLVVSSVFSRLSGIFSDCFEKRLTSTWSVDFSFQDVLERNEFSVKKSGFIFILRDRCTVEVDTSENSASPRIGQHFRFHLPVSVSPRLPAHTPSGGSCIRA